MCRVVSDYSRLAGHADGGAVGGLDLRRLRKNKTKARAATTITIASAAIPPAPYGPEGLKNEVSTRNETVVVAEFPARSNTVSVTVWGPSAKPVMTWEVSEAPRLWAGPPSTLISTRSTPEVASPVENTVVTWEELITLPEAGKTIATSGSVVSTVTVAVATAEWPTWSTPVTVIVWVPSEPPVKVWLVAVPGKLTGDPPSRRTSISARPEPASEAVHVTSRLEEPIIAPFEGPVIWREGGFASTVAVTESDCEFCAASNAVTVNVCGPSDNPVATYEVAVAGRTTGALASTRTSK